MNTSFNWNWLPAAVTPLARTRDTVRRPAADHGFNAAFENGPPARSFAADQIRFIGVNLLYDAGQASLHVVSIGGGCVQGDSRYHRNTRWLG